MDYNSLIGECHFTRGTQKGLSVEETFYEDLHGVSEKALWLSEERVFQDEGIAITKEQQRGQST